MAGGADPLTAQRLAALARRTSELYPLRDLRVTLAGATRPYSVALPADPDAPLDRFATVIGSQSSSNTEFHGGQRSSTESEIPAQTSPKNSVKLASTPLNSALISASAAAAASAADQARRAVASGTHMPYWGLLWPSGLALAEALLTDRDSLRGARALELGCGLGVTATAALECGATLTATDCFAEALLFTRYNARRTLGGEPHTLLVDWRSAAGRAACIAAGPLDALLAADVLYEEEDIAPLLDLAPRLLAPNATFWLAEPGRRVSRLFVEVARLRGWRDDERIYERAWPPDSEVVRVAVHRFTGIG